MPGCGSLDRGVAKPWGVAPGPHTAAEHTPVPQLSMRRAGLHPLLGAAISPSDSPWQRFALPAAGCTEMLLDDGFALSGAAVEVSSLKETLVAVVFTLGQPAPSCISNTS